MTPAFRHICDFVEAQSRAALGIARRDTTEALRHARDAVSHLEALQRAEAEAEAGDMPGELTRIADDFGWSQTPPLPINASQVARAARALADDRRALSVVDRGRAL